MTSSSTGSRSATETTRVDPINEVQPAQAPVVRLLPHGHPDVLGDAAGRHVLWTDQRDHMIHPQFPQTPVTPRRGRFGRDPLACAAWRDRPPEFDLLDPVDLLPQRAA